MSSPKTWPTFKRKFTTALARYLEVSDESCMACKITGRINSTGTSTDYFIQLIASASLPVDGYVINPTSALMDPVKITHTNGVDSTFDIDLGPNFVKSSGGLYVVASTTEFTKTIITADYLACTAFYL